MTLYAPEYYPDFVCLADRCRHSCCVGWEIDIDEATAQHYATLSAPYAEEIRASIDGESGVPHFRLCEADRCPHLNENGLCRIILSLGEEHLCDICREHPRFYHTTKHGMEVGLGLSCEEACRIVLGSDGYDRWVALGEEPDDAERPDFDAVAHRTRIYEVLSDRARLYAERLTCLADAYGVSPSDRADAAWRAQLASLEYLDEAHRALFLCYSSDPTAHAADERWTERALAHWVYRHVSDARDADELCAGLGLALLLERLLTSLIVATGAHALEDVVELARVISEEIEYSEDNT
jgi:lysine-N-methylase